MELASGVALGREGVGRENMTSPFPSFNLLLLLAIAQTLPEATVPASQSAWGGGSREGDGKWNTVSAAFMHCRSFAWIRYAK